MSTERNENAEQLWFGTGFLRPTTAESDLKITLGEISLQNVTAAAKLPCGETLAVNRTLACYNLSRTCHIINFLFALFIFTFVWNNCICLRYDAISTSFTPECILLRWNLLSRAGTRHRIMHFVCNFRSIRSATLHHFPGTTYNFRGN
ncbi:hypothetical protein PUN28_017085 [Cardiocondyla obscurior]|uniref:Uncharacterized protein n=1 Tax=Cardiocondyla obscurior TaxID=286306 RepID=A0AAW2EP56_9HYME